MTKRNTLSTATGEEPVPSGIGRYSILARLSNHKSTAVYRAFDGVNKRDVCIKQLTVVGSKSRSATASMEREVRFGRKLSHPGLVEVYDYVTDTPRHYFVMEYFAPGATLNAVFLGDPPPFRPPPLKIVLLQTAETLAYLHSQGLVHRDIKPENVLINEVGAIKVIDLSVAFERENRLSVWRRLLGGKQRVVGTRSYMPPEQIEGRDVDGRADLYSFGVMMFELLAGRPPFVANNEDALLAKHIKDRPPTLNQVRPEVTPEASKMVERLLAKDPGQRYQKAEDLVYFLNKTKLRTTDKD